MATARNSTATSADTVLDLIARANEALAEGKRLHQEHRELLTEALHQLSAELAEANQEAVLHGWRHAFTHLTRAQAMVTTMLDSLEARH
jgi:hypothetical protein